MEDNECPSPKPPTRELCDSGRVCVTKRLADAGIPMEMMRELWFQTVVDMINIDPVVST